MPTIKRFEDLEVWQAARQAAVAIYKTSEASVTKDWPIKDQLRRAAVSVMANIAEGFDRGSSKEFLKFLTYSLSSVSEVKSHLYLAHDLSYFEQQTFDDLMMQMESLSKRLNKLINYLKSDRARRKPPNQRTGEQ